MKLVLASSSKTRLEILKFLRHSPSLVISPNLDETPMSGESPKNISYRLAGAKARAVYDKLMDNADNEDYLVVGADTVVAAGRLSLPKAEARDQAAFCIDKLSGRRHRVYTSVAMICGDRSIIRTGETIVKFRRILAREREMFLDSDEWAGKAGGYDIQGYASSFVEWMRGDDATNIRGLPTCVTLKMIRSMLYDGRDA